MFRTNRTLIATVTLTVSGFALMFASGCSNSVSGPELRASEPIGRRVPVELQGLEKAGFQVNVTPTVTGDITGDGQVDSSDLAAFAFLMRADINNDQMVDGFDEVALAMLMSGGVPDLAQPQGIIDASDYAALAGARARADLTQDGRVDASDLACLTWMRHRGDLDGDGIVSRRDLHIIAPEVTP